MRRQLGTKGFSLVELLVGVTILAIIVIPLVNAFITSQNASSRAKEIRNETLAAQNVIEAYKATDIGALIDKVKSGQTPLGSLAAASTVYAYNSVSGAYDQVTLTSTEAKDGPAYKLNLTGVAAGAKTYDAILYVDATKYAQQNSAPIVDYKPMDALISQPDPAKDANNDPDVIAAKTFASWATVSSGVTVLSDYFYTPTLGTSRMARTIKITIEKLPSAPGSLSGNISCKARFQYVTSYTYTVTDNTKTPPAVTSVTVPYSTEVPYPDFYNGSYSPTEKGINGLYMFYYPNTCTNPAVRNQNGSYDDIEIYNTDDIEVSIYLIAQGNIAGYSPTINLWETYNNSAPKGKYALMYSNLTGSYNEKMSGFTTGIFFEDTLIGTPPKNRLYGVKVELYKAGTGFAAPPLTTFDASSLK